MIIGLTIISKTVLTRFSRIVLSVKNNVRFFVHCHHFSSQKETLMNNIESIDEVFLMCLKKKVYILLFGCSKSKYHTDSKAMIFLIEFTLISLV